MRWKDQLTSASGSKKIYDFLYAKEWLDE